MLALSIRYDDAFIAYLNGEEILRAGVGKGSGPTASGVAVRAAPGGPVFFEIKYPPHLLREGENVLAIEGHNANADSPGFTLEPRLLVLKRTDEAGNGLLGETANSPVGADYAPASRALVVMDRHSGRLLWTRPARYSFRHNAIAAAAGKIFCIDRMTRRKLEYIRRRGYEVREEPTLYALDARTGSVIWQTTENVFGTWLGYSEEYGILLEAGSAHRDRAPDEATRGLVARTGSDGRELWRSARQYAGPCLLHHDTVFTQNDALSLVTGEPRLRAHPLTGEAVPWTFSRNYGCNTVIGSENLLTFRSAAAGFYDLIAAAGTGNLGGFKSGCTSNLVVADGVLNAPDYTRTCSCSYQNQCSLALVHDPTAEVWTFTDLTWSGARIRRVGINFGAPGDRLAEDGVLWLDYPSVGGPSPEVPVSVHGQTLRYFRRHSSRVDGSGLPWVAASGVSGCERLTIGLAKKATAKRPYTVRLHFAEPRSGTATGQRVFDVSLQGRTVLENFDIAEAAGGPRRAVVRQFRSVGLSDELVLGLEPRAGTPVLCGVELTEETE